MESFRALQLSTGRSGFDRIHLDVDCLGADGSAGAVYLLPADALAALPAGAVRDLGTKHPAAPLGRYFSARVQGTAMLRADYRDPGQTRRGVQSLLRSLAGIRTPSVCLIGIPPALFDRMWRDAGGGTDALDTGGKDGGVSATLRDLLAANPAIRVPESLRRAFVGESAGADEVRRLIVLAARSPHPVLIEGETGTGKEVVARQIHALGPRHAESFVPVNCGGIPADLLESELFGHMRGAFTGALRDKPGLWTIADRGTLFLDEIGDLSPHQQAKVLRVLEDGRFHAVGGERELESHARVIAATNADLRRLVAAGAFRADLYYRLCPLTIRTPALRERRDDIAPIAAHLWTRLCADIAAALPPAILAELRQLPWHGNVRELRAFLANLSMLADSGPPTLAMTRALIRDRYGPTPPARDE